MIIRTFSNAWACDVRELVLGVLQEEGFCYDPVKDFDLEDIKGYYLEDGGMFYLGFIEYELVGTGAIRNVDGHRCEIKRIYVKKQWRRKGFGRQLFLMSLGFAKGNYSKALLKTDKGLEDAIRLYLRNGFRVVKEEGQIVYFEKDL